MSVEALATHIKASQPAICYTLQNEYRDSLLQPSPGSLDYCRVLSLCSFYCRLMIRSLSGLVVKLRLFKLIFTINAISLTTGYNLHVPGISVRSRSFRFRCSCHRHPIAISKYDWNCQSWTELHRKGDAMSIS